MRALRRSVTASDSRYRVHADLGPSPTLALLVSLMVHAVLVLLLYEAYTELASVPPLVTLLAAESAPTPSFAVSRPEPQEAEQAAERPRAVELPLLPRRPAALDEPLAVGPALSDLTERQWTKPSANSTPSRRATLPASLPVAKVDLPPLADQNPAAPDAARRALPDIVPLERTRSPFAMSHEPLPRIASRPTYGSSPHRPTRLALLPAANFRHVEQSRRRNSAPAFADRGAVGRLSPEAAATVDRGLEFLARVQLDDGGWRFDDLRGLIDADAEPVSIRADAAATGLALLAFLGAGQDHFDGRYRRVVEDALDYLVHLQQDSGELFRDSGLPLGQVTRFYSHGIATLALCEAFGMTGDAKLREPAERALEYLAATQHPDLGGWRYQPGASADLSVTGWQLVALRSGQLAGLTVRGETLTRIGECLAVCRDHESRPGLYRYNPWASPTDPLTSHGRQPSTVMTAVGLTMELHLGTAPSDDRLLPGARHLLANLPLVGDSPAAAPVGTLGNPQRDTYYWYYGTQTMFYLGGEYWQAWSEKLQPLLVQSQVRDGPLAGSWDPLKPVRDKWADYGGRIYVTALNLLSLEIPSRHLPLESRDTPHIAAEPE